MKLYYPVQPVADYYLQNYSLTQQQFEGTFSSNQASPYWNLLHDVNLGVVKGFLLSLALRVGWLSGPTDQLFGFRIGMADDEDYYILYSYYGTFNDFRYINQMPFYPAIPLKPQTHISLSWYWDGMTTFSVDWKYSVLYSNYI